MWINKRKFKNLVAQVNLIEGMLKATNEQVHTLRTEKAMAAFEADAIKRGYTSFENKEVKPPHDAYMLVLYWDWNKISGRQGYCAPDENVYYLPQKDERLVAWKKINGEGLKTAEERKKDKK